MKKIKEKYLQIILVILDTIIIILSFLPNSSVLKFSIINENGNPDVYLRYYSSFDPINIGYANFGPFLSAYISVISLVFIVIFITNNKLKEVIMILTISGLIVSLFPFILTSITIFTPVITVIWLILVLVIFLFDKKNKCAENIYKENN